MIILLYSYKLAVGSNGCFPICFCSLFLCFIATEIFFLAVKGNGRAPPAEFFNKGHAFEPGGVVGFQPNIAEIFRACGEPKVAKSVIGAISIDVVDVIWRPLACDVEPCEPCGPVVLIVYRHDDVSAVCIRDDLTGPSCIPFFWNIAPHSPPEKTCVWIVIERLAQKCLRELDWVLAIGYRHGSLPSGVIGSRVRRGGSLVAIRHAVTLYAVA